MLQIFRPVFRLDAIHSNAFNVFNFSCVNQKHSLSLNQSNCYNILQSTREPLSDQIAIANVVQADNLCAVTNYYECNFNDQFEYWFMHSTFFLFYSHCLSVGLSVCLSVSLSSQIHTSSLLDLHANLLSSSIVIITFLIHLFNSGIFSVL